MAPPRPEEIKHGGNEDPKQLRVQEVENTREFFCNPAKQDKSPKACSQPDKSQRQRRAIERPLLDAIAKQALSKDARVLRIPRQLQRQPPPRLARAARQSKSSRCRDQAIRGEISLQCPHSSCFKWMGLEDSPPTIVENRVGYVGNLFYLTMSKGGIYAR
jgi:hypothetical protein